MGQRTKIEWADATWNPIDGCSPVSEGCENCYARNMAKRFWQARRFAEVQIHRERLSDPYEWEQPKRIFLGSMTDLGHPQIPVTWLFPVFTAIELNPRHTFIVLTKRPGELLTKMEHINRWQEFGYSGRNLWLGVSAENQKRAKERIPFLRHFKAAKKFVSCEPLLDKIDLREWLEINRVEPFGDWTRSGYKPELDWVVAGYETGRHARGGELEWARFLREQCEAAYVPFFFKKPPKGEVLIPEDLRVFQIPNGFV